MKYSILLVSFLFILSVSCNKVKDSEKSVQNGTSKGTGYTFGLVTGLGELGDFAFNDMQYNGMIMAKKQFGISFHYNSPKTVEEDTAKIEELIRKGCNVIFAGGGYHMIDPVDKLAPKYPQVLFILLDDTPKTLYKNVAGIIFKQNEGSFLAGALAASMTRSNSIGTVSAMNLTIINDFIVGFKAGALYVKPNIQFHNLYLAEDMKSSNPFSDPQMGFNASVKLIKQYKTDVLFQIASASGTGVFNAAKEEGIFAIGVDSDQDFLAKGTVLTSMMKRLDVAILFMVERIIGNNFENRVFSLGLKENGIGLSPMQYTKNIIPETVRTKISVIEKDIIEGKIHVPSSYK